jgi:hypothetical protein
LSEESLAHFGDDCEFRIYYVRDLVLHPLAKQKAGAAFVKPVTLHKPARQFSGRVLKGLIEGARTAEHHDEVLVFEARPVDFFASSVKFVGDGER